MITIKEIKGHLAHTVYSSGARKTILGFLIGRGFDTDEIEFAKRNCSAREKSAKTFEDFMRFMCETDIPKFGLSSEFRGMCEEAAQNLAEAVDAFCRSVNSDKNIPNEDPDDILKSIGINPKTYEPFKSDDFQIGDWVKYIPEPGEESTECIEAIAHGTDGEMYLCLSNGEYVRPCYCVKYKAQGEERRKLIDELNEVI